MFFKQIISQNTFTVTFISSLIDVKKEKIFKDLMKMYACQVYILIKTFQNTRVLLDN